MKRLKHILDAVDTVSLFEDNPIPMWIFRETGQEIISVNRAAVSIYGYSANKFTRKRISELYPKGDRELFLKLFSGDISEIQDMGVWRHRTADGSLLNVDIRYQPIRHANESGLWLVIALPVDRQADLSVIKKHKNMGMYRFLKKTNPTEEDLKWLKNIYNYVLEHLDETITIDELSVSTTQSSRSLNRSCNELTGFPPLQLVQQIKFGRVRLYYEAGLLKNPGEMAEMIGYTDTSYFLQKYKELFGMALKS